MIYSRICWVCPSNGMYPKDQRVAFETSEGWCLSLESRSVGEHKSHFTMVEKGDISN